jgi:hypothetical protein
MDDETITITLEEYQDLQDSSKFLMCLHAAGVDNWDGYDWAMEEFQNG